MYICISVKQPVSLQLVRSIIIPSWHDAAEGWLMGVASKVEIKMVAKDYQEFSKDDFPAVGLMLMVNCT